MSRTYPGHEVVGRIEALGDGVSRWRIGQRGPVGAPSQPRWIIQKRARLNKF
jgi:D-arabinose 1-dehydrogenase-like Zn-dependent alcohol dehydrogenase